jgi:hypothetical protein
MHDPSQRQPSCKEQFCRTLVREAPDAKQRLGERSRVE